MLQRFRDELVLPFADRLRVFNPVEVRPAWLRAAGDARNAAGAADG